MAAHFPRWYRLAQVLDARAGRDPLPHQARDADASLFLGGLLRARGYEYGGLLLNYPERSGAERSASVDTIVRQDDLIVHTTRPALHDHVDGARLSLRPTGAAHEELIMRVARQHLSHCSRRRVTVVDAHAKSSAGVAGMWNVQFLSTRGAGIDASMSFNKGKWQRHTGGRTSIAYLIFEPNAGVNGGPAVLISFGMCGPDTLAWNLILATRFPHLVADKSTRFAMAEITPPTGPSTSRYVADYANEWQVRFLTGHSSK